tara:strand:+ start:324 stop:578 length:255 start_codon:yes stop_codon:yes gene_type:complete
MKDTPLKIYDRSVTGKWDFEKQVEYEINITNIIRFTELRGKPLTIEYIDDNLNVIRTLKFKGNKKKFLEYEAKINKLLKGEIPE